MEKKNTSESIVNYITLGMVLLVIVLYCVLA